MINIPGYTIKEKIYENFRTIVYRAVKHRYNQDVIIKIIKSEYPTSKEIAQLGNEYKITKDLNLEEVVKAYGLEKYNNALALILEDFGGKSLKDVLNINKINLISALKIASNIAEALGKLHKLNIIHKDIKPENIIINSETGQIKITDFSIASSLSKENQTINNPNLLEGTLAYMSPEQTGRMNRSIDYRTDFYSLGITLYELLTGQLPFAAIDPMELVHCHIAKKPVSPHKLNPEIPQAVSDITLKLLAKTAEDRYQSAYGIKADLEFCLTQLETIGQIENFVLAKNDISANFQIPQKLYGREREIETLMAAFERVSLDTTEMMLVAGYSGIGKSALVNEIHKAIVRKRGYFIAGKFDQFKRNIPYASLIQAFQELIRQLLTETEEQIAIWRNKLTEALGPNGQVIVDVIPEVELIIGQQPDVPQLEPSEAQNRFNLVFQKFLNVFTRKEHPLVLFLDDLQWADSASLKLLQMLMTASDQCLLMLGAYRDNEVSPTHGMMLTLEEIQKCGAIVNTITLAPLAVDNVNQLIADTLHCETAKSRPLAELLFKKTNGNPFFLTQMLTSLYQEQLLSFDISSGCWQWNIEQIQNMGITDNVVELMVSKIQKLSIPTQNILKLAACIGNTFNLNLLSIVNEKSLSATATELWEALQAGLILPLSDAYKIPLVEGPEASIASNNEQVVVDYRFLHDRVQQAAYFIIPESSKKETHLKVGQLLLKHSQPAEREENIFDIVNQLNIGAELIADRSERNELAQLNLIAGRKAKASTAYESALKYLTVGIELLTEDSWQNNYDLTSALFIEAVEVEYLNTHFQQAERLSEIVLAHAQNLLQKVKVYETKIHFYIAQNQMFAAIDTSMQALELLNEPLCQEAPTTASIEELLDLPEMTDANKLAAMRILITLLTPGLNAKPALLPPVAFTLANLASKYGNSDLAAVGYAFYGLILCGGLQQIEAGYSFGKLGLRLMERYNAKKLEAKVQNMFNVFVRHWKEPAQTTIEPLLNGVQVGLETGDLEYACYNATSYCNHIFFVGEPLEEVNQNQSKYIDLLLRLKQEYQIYFSQIVRQLVQNLIGDVEDKYLLVGTSFNELEMVPVFRETQMGTLLFLYSLAKTILLYLLREYEQAATIARDAEKYHGNMVGFMQFVEYDFYYSLSLLAIYPKAEESEQIEILDKVTSKQQRMKEWAIQAPSNYQHKYDLIEAEKARVLGQHLEAMKYYEQAAKCAKEQGYVHEEALANELAAEFYFSQEIDKMAQMYLVESYYGYVRWGATTKVKDLESRYPQLISRTTGATSIRLNSTTTSSTLSSNSGALDLATIVKASQAIAGEIVLSKLLDKLLKIVMENAGAQTSCLILEKDGKLLIEATGAVDQDEITFWESVPVSTSENLPVSIINYVSRTHENVVLSNASKEGKFTRDPYCIKHKPQSVLCTPIINQSKLIGLLYLENNLTTGAFTSERLEVLKLLSSQAAISLENAILYTDLEAATEDIKKANNQLEEYNRTLEHKVEERTLQLRDKNIRLKEQATQLNQTLQELKHTQAQLIQTEKMSSLGQMVAGVAHEINNPVNFIYGNLMHTGSYIQDLLELVELYQDQYPNPTSEIKSHADAIDVEFLSEDLPKLLKSMQVGADRIREIVLSLRSFARLDEADMKKVDIHEGIDSTLLILQHRLNKEIGNCHIEIVKNYGHLPVVECYAGQLNQVFMNVINNAIDALEEKIDKVQQSGTNDRLITSSYSPTITISTNVLESDRIAICIADNGLGMTEEVLHKLFDPFFTTKAVGSGTGLGLSISYQIVVDKHGGQLRCNSALGGGAEFIIEIPVQQSGVQIPKLSTATV